MSFKKINLPNPVIKIEEHINIPEEYRNCLDTIWSREKKNNIIFDGKVLYYKKIIDEEILCSYSNYRYWYSQSKLNNDSHFESIYPIAVTGIVKNGNQILLGKRGKNVSQDKGLYDLLPSGGISDNCNGDYEFQLMQEFNEELSGQLHDIISIKFLYILKDNNDKVIDIVSIINVNRPLNTFINNKSEYDDLLILKLQRKSFYQIRQKLSPISKFIIEDLLNMDKL